MKAINEDRFVDSVMIDFKTPFDMVDHRILLKKKKKKKTKKLIMYKYSDNTMPWFHSYFSDRGQMFFINGKHSEKKYAEFLKGLF